MTSTSNGSPSPPSLYFAKGNLEVIRLSQDGSLTPVAPNLAESSERLGGIKGLAFGPDGSLYVACPSAVLKIKADGTAATVAESIAVSDCDSELPPNTPMSQLPYLRGLAVDERGVVYAAATGCRAVVRITSDGRVSVILRAQPPWSPTGVAVLFKDVYVLEYEHPNSARREEWRPRIRKIGSDGTVTTLATLPTAQGRPATAQPR